MLQNKNQSGFSLIELLMVVVIVGLLATVAVPSLLGSRDAAQKAAIIGSLRTIHSHQTTYLSQRGRYATIVELNTFLDNTLGRTSGNRVITGDYTYINGISNTTTLATRYQVWVAKFENSWFVTFEFVMEQDGVIQGIDL